MNNQRGNLRIYALLCAVVLLVYSPVRVHDFINYDDPVYVTDNPHVHDGLTWDGIVWAFTSFEHSNWFPLTWLSHMLDVQMFGFDPGWHHLSSVALHTISTLCLFALLWSMTRARWPSAFVALAFGLHPLHVESVAWAAERKDVLSVLFCILTLWAYVWYSEQPSWRRYLAIAGLFVCGLMSKPMLVTLPFVMLLLDYWPLRRKLGRSVVVDKMPLLALSVAASIIAFIAQRQSGAVAALDRIPVTLRIENALVTYIVYLVKFVWPAKLAIFYPYAERIPLWQWLGAALAIAAVTMAVLLVRSTRPYLAVGWLWYLGTLVPVIGLVQVGSQARADRYTYLPLIGISIMLAWAIPARRSFAIVGAVVCSIWCVVTWTYLGAWRDSASLFRHAIQVTDRNWVMYNNLGGTLRRQGQIQEAIANFENAVRLRPDLADVQDNLGEALVNVGRLDQGVPHLMEALRIQPKFAKARVDFGSALLRQGRDREAADQFLEALRIDPVNAEAHFRLGGLLAAHGQTKAALPQLQAALPYLIETAHNNPDDPESHHNLGGVLGMIGRMDEAIAEFSQEVRLRPSDPEAHYNLALALADKQRLVDSANEFSQAVRLKPDYVMAHFNLARILVALGKGVDAEREFSETLRLAPDFAGAKEGLAKLKQ
ncbi:MAG TPA: tetratricopeptide repeat protein [Bryobacteraceae bacterium]|nr:tetratricopeptide repeat protein [Bryobacteraceae bacterium]